MTFLIEKGSRPDFDDDLEEWQKPLFEQVEDLEYPDELGDVGEKGLFLHWWEIEATLSDLDQKFQACQGRIVKAYKRGGEDSYIDGSVGDRLYRCDADRLKRVDTKKQSLKMPAELPESRDSVYLTALLQDF
ncbi:hypothetical protein [Allohahella sp. A8]|uniref:hypothetical protein n=1 Tax=Allohahella sp. A8 TaxID=3141461 RepID=UPI003A807573